MLSAIFAALLLIAAAAPALALAGTCDFTQRSAVGTPFINETKVTDASRLPAARPPLWNFRTLAGATWSCVPKKSGWLLTVTHKPVPGVTKEAFKWMWENMATAQAVSGHGIDHGGPARRPMRGCEGLPGQPSRTRRVRRTTSALLPGLKPPRPPPRPLPPQTGADGKSYPMFQAFHPRDHAFTDSTLKPLAKGATATYVEFPLTGCSGTGAGAPWTCPTGGSPNPGYLQSTPKSEWECVDQVNTTNTKVISLSTGSIKFGIQGCSDKNPKACTYIITTTHAWKFVKPTNSLSVKTTLKIGYGNPVNDIRIVDGWRNGVNAQEKCERQALHFVEEIGATEFWLQAAYTARLG
jgi:hypothetical protein